LNAPCAWPDFLQKLELWMRHGEGGMVKNNVYCVRAQEARGLRFRRIVPALMFWIVGIARSTMA
jgi:hypothetical protein